MFEKPGLGENSGYLTPKKPELHEKKLGVGVFSRVTHSTVTVQYVTMNLLNNANRGSLS